MPHDNTEAHPNRLTREKMQRLRGKAGRSDRPLFLTFLIIVVFPQKVYDPPWLRPVPDQVPQLPDLVEPAALTRVFDYTLERLKVGVNIRDNQKAQI